MKGLNVSFNLVYHKTLYNISLRSYTNLNVCTDNTNLAAAILDLCKLGNVPPLGFSGTFNMLY